jgi:hypothetical protein
MLTKQLPLLAWRAFVLDSEHIDHTSLSGLQHDHSQSIQVILLIAVIWINETGLRGTSMLIDQLNLCFVRMLEKRYTNAYPVSAEVTSKSSRYVQKAMQTGCDCKHSSSQGDIVTNINTADSTRQTR